ncbi:MAG: beta-ketoacyl synthase chain length factor [Bacteroidota bacterium]
MMFYINQTSCISPQDSILFDDNYILRKATGGKLLALEPGYKNIPSAQLRRMGKAVRIGVGAALPLLHQGNDVNGIIIGTANGGMEDCMKFLRQIIEFDEDTLTPGNFVQGVPNAVASQLGLLTHNLGYNITNVHRGLAFENSMIDAMLLLNEHPHNSYLLGAVDEISDFNYKIELLNGNYKQQVIGATDFYESGSQGSLAGEGASMFVVSNKKETAIAKLEFMETIHSNDELEIKNWIEGKIRSHLIEKDNIDLLLTGENGDNRFLKYYTGIESKFNNKIPIARYKHLCGEYATASAYAVWLICELFKNNKVPLLIIKEGEPPQKIEKVLLYTNYLGEQHSLMLFSNVE